MEKKERSEIKNMLYAWGSYKYIISLERKELEDMKRLYNNMTDIKSVCRIGERKKTTVDEAFDKNVRLCQGRLERLNKMIKTYMESKEKLDKIIDNMSYVEQHILRARYEKNLSWEIMPFNLPFEMCKRHCQRWHNAALEKIYEELKNRGEI